MGKRAHVRIDREFVISKVDDRLYGGFAEHLGRHIYTGIYEPGHPTADVPSAVRGSGKRSGMKVACAFSNEGC